MKKRVISETDCITDRKFFVSVSKCQDGKVVPMHGQELFDALEFMKSIR